MTLKQVSIPHSRKIWSQKWNIFPMLRSLTLRASLLIVNMIFENCGSWLEIGQIWSQNCNVFQLLWNLGLSANRTCWLFILLIWYLELMILTQSYRLGQILSQHWNWLRLLWNLVLTTKWNMLIMNTRDGLERMRDYWLRMIIGCKIRLAFRT